MAFGLMRDMISLREPVESAGPGGVVVTVFEERYRGAAQFIFQRGSEVIEAARQEGRAIYKIRVAKCQATRKVTTDWIMVDTRRYAENASGHAVSGRYAVTGVDTISDPAWVWLMVEEGKPQ